MSFSFQNISELASISAMKMSFPKNSREYVRSGANLLITLTNDSWYKETAGGAQHTAHSIFRAVENGLPLIRCGTTSESCYISPKGKIQNLIKNEDGSRFTRGTAIVNITSLAPKHYLLLPKPAFSHDLHFRNRFSCIFINCPSLFKKKE